MSSSPASVKFKSGTGARVAVVGAGISGVTAAAHLLNQGLSVTVFERSSISGGVWHFDERTAEDPSYPSNTPSVGDYELSSPGQYAYRTPPPDPVDGVEEKDTKPKLTDDALEVHFSPPGPCYAGLKNNVPTTLMYSVLDPWPEGTEEHTGQENIERYVQTLAHNHGVENVTQYSTRVDEIKKSEDGVTWTVRTVALEKLHGAAQLVEKYWEFDFVVIASGHYNLPRIPDTAGLKEWKATFKDRVIHSKQYRKAETFRGKNLLIIGAGVSSTDICRELGEVADKIFQSVRGGAFDLPPSLLPEVAERVAEVSSYEVDAGCASDVPLAPEDHIPGRIVLRDGRALSDIDYVIIATGYITSYPFLPQLHSDTVPAAEAGPHLVVTADGEMAHNLHKDIFYIPDPTLAFVGVPYYVATFSLFDFQSQIVARVLGGKAILPPEDKMRDEYQARLDERGVGRGFHSLRMPGQEIAYVKDLVDWANRDAKELGVEEMRGHSQAWLDGYEEMKERMRKLLGRDL
ncbi:FAD/NAD(P)-binding domain-containing protein [Coniochaeta ligniaria NRRL 30616]|uniref:FAD/NAD(P)-binding domain-containing protein n=1 Tax=Coniochaeta ligniaria NRRL 30616 TaxID=1408157 RepID=A0A1J7J446_9PEZI|nr:FAD/NAD(P)-binding domain-containing protein [Coniochaeta ligniaria NRRL 30616]